MHLVRETLQAAVTYGHEVAASIEPVISPIMLSMWASHVSDPFISIDALEVLEAIKKTHGRIHPLPSRVLPYIGPILNNATTTVTRWLSCWLSGSCYNTSENAPIYVLKEAYQVSFDPVVRIVLHRNDHNEMQVKVALGRRIFLKKSEAVVQRRIIWSDLTHEMKIEFLMFKKHQPEPSHVAASTSTRRPESPRSVARKAQLNAFGQQSLFLQDAVDALYQVGKEMDWLKLTASEEMESAKVEMSKIAEAFSTLPKDLKEAFAKFQHLEEQSLLEEQSQLRTVESKTVAVLEFTDSRISDHDAKIQEMAKVIASFDEKLAKFEEQQDSILKVLRSIDHTVSELNARKGEGQPDSSRVSAQRSPGQESHARSSEHESSRRSSSRI
ncbi:hypothetical protein OROHE_017171 [Orobanche hederae]